MLIAIPAFRLSCKVGIDRGRAWSVLDELILWATAREPRSIAQLSNEANLPRQIVVASIARLMRFRLIELAVKGDRAAFQASAYGTEVVASGRPLPFFPKREIRRVSFVIEHATGGFFPSGQLRMRSAKALKHEPDPDVRVIVVEGGGPSMSNEATLGRLSQVAARGFEEQVALVDSRTASLKSEYMVIRVVDGVARNIPEDASETLKAIIEQAAAQPVGTTQVQIGYAGQQVDRDPPPVAHQCNFDLDDLIIGGSAQRDCLMGILEQAESRVIMHSTFLDHLRFRDLVADIRAACMRGVSFDLLWGAETLDQDEQENKNSRAAAAISKIIRDDPDLARRFRVHMRSTWSHAKLLLADTKDGGWLAAVSSCNWLSSPFRATEFTAVLRDPFVVADVATALQRLVGRRGLSDEISYEMGIVARELRQRPIGGGPASISLVLGERHDVLMREVSGAAGTRIEVGSNRLGSTARPGVVMPGEAAARRGDVGVRLLYSYPTGPLKKRHARKLAEEAAVNGVWLIKTETVPLHGKYLAWDDDDLAVTSLNWASASTDIDFPQADIGVHIHLPGIAGHAMARLAQIYPELEDRTTKESRAQEKEGVIG